jgi:SOS-response transcriptional repressor LexA/CheY-like chemotaxis protein
VPSPFLARPPAEWVASNDLAFAILDGYPVSLGHTRKQHLHTLERHRFDYVVVDEVHHATAPSYQRILDHLEPRFVLGLTATPERSDEADVLGLFDDNLVHRADLGVGIAAGRLVPFAYFGLKDDIDYANIPWRNKRFDPVELARAVQTERRMECMWQACEQHVGRRTLFFCASVSHADYVRQWLGERGLRVRAVHSGQTADDRSEALRAIEQGQVDAICSVDMLSEGIDLPTVDRVVMLRPTESPVVFLQQLGRGLRRPQGDSRKAQLTVIDFVGNHRVFLDRLRRLISLASPGARDTLRQVIEQDGPIELPHGCTVDVELEAKQLLEALLPKGKSEVERVYRELHAMRGERPTAGELQRMGVLPSTLRSEHDSWFDFVASEAHLSPDELAVLASSRRWLVELERTSMTRCFKMVVVLALLEEGSLRDGMRLEDLAARSHAILARSPELMVDVADPQLFATLDATNRDAWLQYWTKNPITHWTKPTQAHPRRAFLIEDGRFVPQFQVPADHQETLERMTRELVDYRLAQYRARSLTQAKGSVFTCKVTWNQRDPIIKLPARTANPDVPHGEVDVRLRDGRVWQFRFAEQFCNVARSAGAKRNELPDLLRSWFGPSAGHPGTGFHVRFSPRPDGWWIEPAGQMLTLPSRNHVTAYPDLRAAAGAAEGGQENVQASQVALPIATADERLFAVRASGSSMDGGKRPIRDGDWLLLRLSRDASLSALEGRVALVELPGDAFGTRYQVKRIQRRDGAWQLTSDNPAFESYPATADTVPIALLVDAIAPERLAPAEGTLLADDELAAAFALSEPPRTGRVDGHLFVCITAPGAFEAPDRLRFPQPGALPFERRPGETAFVLTRDGAKGAWRYAGVARWIEDEGLWGLPAVDHGTWKALGHGRAASRRLPAGRLDEARALVERVLQTHGAGSWLEAHGKRCRLVGPAAQGGLRIDGGQDGFAERTVSATDIAWVLAARDDVAHHGGVLDEARVNRLRYLDGTPKGATRWIDTGWGVVVVERG